MRVTTRLLILFIAIGFAFLAYFYLFVHYKNTETRILLEYDQMQRKQSIDAVFKINKSTELQVLSDYSSRDELINYVANPSLNWARRNLDPMIEVYDFSIVQIYDKNKELLYSNEAESYVNLKQYRLEPAMLDSLNSKRNLDLSSAYGSNLLSLSASAIHTAADSLVSSPLGYIVVGKIWDNKFFTDIAKSLSYDLAVTSIEPTIDNPPDIQSNIKIVYRIADWKGNPVVWLTFYVINTSLKDIQYLGRQVIFVTGAFIVLFFLIQFVLIEQWITVPLKILSKSLKENRVDVLDRVRGNDSEFSILGNLIEQFFEQKATLTREIETRERTQVQLREIEEQTLTIFLTSPESIVVTDLEGRVLTANDETFHLFGLPEYVKEHPGFSFLDYIDPISRDDMESLIQNLINGEDIRNREYQALRADGSSFTALISASLIKNAQQIPVRIILITRDLTEIKNLELQLLQAQKMESLGTLAGGIAHDFNNIMTIIAGYIAVSSAKIDGHTEAQDDLDEALKACLRAKNLISKILTFSRNSEKLIQSVSIAEILEESLPMIRASIPTIIEISTDIQSRKNCLADPTEIQQVLINLSSNSFYAMRKGGGNLTFSVRDVPGFELIGLDPEVKIDKEYIQLCVADTGSGIQQDIFSRIFDPYFSTKTTGEGTGLGLSIVHGIVKNSGGFISVHSVIEEGTQFNIYLPVVDSSAIPARAHKTPSYPFIPARIMFVDDEVSLTELFGESLTGAGYQVEIYSDSKLAFAAFEAAPQNYDLIIADVTMPILDGIKLAGMIREISKIPIILYTGYSVYNMKSEMESISVNRILSKPILPADMINSVKEVLHERSRN